MVIELLRFNVSPEARERFIQKDAEIWTAAIAGYSGFLGKEVWINPEASEEIVIVIRWRTRQEWKAVPLDVLEATELKFATAMGEAKYQMVETSEYQVRKFPDVSM